MTTRTTSILGHLEGALKLLVGLFFHREMPDDVYRRLIERHFSWGVGSLSGHTEELVQQPPEGRN